MRAQCTIFILASAVAMITAMPSELKDSHGYPTKCTKDSDCASIHVCTPQKLCVDPCFGVCGSNAYCLVVNRSPICNCPVGMAGNPFIACKTRQIGPDSESPMNRSKCSEDSDCADKLFCSKGNCNDPCSQRCGYNAYCTVLNHHAVCNCPPSMTGDPFSICRSIEESKYYNNYSKSLSGTSRSTCTKDSDCIFELACINGKCSDPCKGACGPNAICSIANHNAYCSCQPGMIADVTRNGHCVPNLPLLPN